MKNSNAMHLISAAMAMGAMDNIPLIGAGEMKGEPKPKTEADYARMRKAQRKRERKAQKLLERERKRDGVS